MATLSVAAIFGRCSKYLWRIVPQKQEGCDARCTNITIMTGECQAPRKSHRVQHISEPDRDFVIFGAVLLQKPRYYILGLLLFTLNDTCVTCERRKLSVKSLRIQHNGLCVFCSEPGTLLCLLVLLLPVDVTVDWVLVL